tara:strand:+ start:520 stop:1062 length:543 start_codon:yes stop_codon:yes gene_type:complete
MKNIMPFGAVVIALFFTPCALAFDDQQLSQAVKICAQQNDNLLRLRCFDNVVEKLTLAKKLIITPSNQLKSAQVSKKEILPIVNTSVKTVDLFAKNHLEKTAKGQLEKVNEITATITQAKKMLRGQWQVSLNNGQQWQQKDSLYLNLSRGDEVVLQEGALGAFYLKKLTSNRRIRVRRIM